MAQPNEAARWRSHAPASACALVAALGLGACGNTEALSRPLAAEAVAVVGAAAEAEASHHEVRPSGLAGSITFGPEVVFGDREDHALGTPVFGALVNGRGQIILASPDGIQVFDSEGAFVRRIGEEGDGPGAFRRPRGIVAGPDDSLFVFHDTGVSVFDREGALVRQVAFPQPPTSPIRLESGAFLSWTPPGRGQGGSSLYLHDAAFAPQALPQTPPGMLEGVTEAASSGLALAGPITVGTASGGSFWVAARSPYRFERWTSEGEVERLLEPNADHLVPREQTRILPSGRPVTTNTPYVSAIGEDLEERLWTAVAELVEGGEVDLPPGGMRFESLIEVWDPRTRERLASGRVPGQVSRIQPDGHLVASWSAPNGEQRLSVRHARLEVGSPEVDSGATDAKALGSDDPPAGYRIVEAAELPERLHEIYADSAFSLTVDRSAADDFERDLIRTAERLLPTEATFSALMAEGDPSRMASGNWPNLLARAETLEAELGPRWWWLEWDRTLLPVALGAASIHHYVGLLRHRAVTPNPFGPEPHRGHLHYAARAEPAAGGEGDAAAWLVVLELRFTYYCGGRCALSFQHDRRVHFDAEGRPLRVEGDRIPQVAVS